MSFVAADEILGGTAQVRTLTLAHHHRLPDGDYAMVETYCTERLRVFQSCPLTTPKRARSSLQMLAVARATAPLCA